MSTMKLILTQEVTGLGSSGDTVEVKGGYGRNYLLPRGLAILLVYVGGFGALCVLSYMLVATAVTQLVTLTQSLQVSLASPGSTSQDARSHTDRVSAAVQRSATGCLRRSESSTAL